MSLPTLPLLENPSWAAVPSVEVEPGVPRVRVVTMGCKVNQYEAQLVKEAFERQGFEEARAGVAADVCVVNTCTVTGEADSKARQIVRRLARENPGSRTIVFGCYAARDRAALEALPGVVAVVGDNRELPDVLARFGVTNWPGGIARFDGHRRAFVKVQDGCALKCTYCIIPTVRGGLRSREPEAILEEVGRLVETGYREIVLTGIHLGHFGVEATRGRSGRARYRLGHLLSDLDRIPGEWRLRLSSLDPGEVDGEFLERVGDLERLCPHFHLCLQSGADDVLARMRRRYRAGRFLENVAALRGRFERLALSTDVIVGFPGESDEEFEQTLAVCRAAEVMQIHAFPFSPRKGTPAATFPDQIPGEVKARRMTRLHELERTLAGEYHSGLMGSELSVMLEASPSTRSGHIGGTACRFVRVELPHPGDGRAQAGQLIRVRVTAATGDDVVGVACEERSS